MVWQAGVISLYFELRTQNLEYRLGVSHSRYSRTSNTPANLTLFLGLYFPGFEKDPITVTVGCVLDVLICIDY